MKKIIFAVVALFVSISAQANPYAEFEVSPHLASKVQANASSLGAVTVGQTFGTVRGDVKLSYVQDKIAKTVADEAQVRVAYDITPNLFVRGGLGQGIGQANNAFYTAAVSMSAPVSEHVIASLTAEHKSDFAKNGSQVNEFRGGVAYAFSSSEVSLTYLTQYGDAAKRGLVAGLKTYF